jgi:hypothetical protein
MIKRHLFVLIVLSSIFCTSTLQGQTRSAVIVRPAVTGIALQPATPAKNLTGPVVAPNPPGSANAEDDSAEAEKAQRLQKIQQLQFNRRPSAILAAWPAADGKPDDKKVDPATTEQEGDKQPQPDPFDEELKMFQLAVTMGRWADVKHFLAEHLSAEEGKIAYRQLLQGMMRPPTNSESMTSEQMRVMQQLGVTSSQLSQMRQMQSQRSRQPEQQSASLDDFIALVRAAPHELDKGTLVLLGGVLRLSLQSGNVVEGLLVRLRAEIEKPEADAILTKRQSAKLLFAAGKALEAGEFLPKREQAEKDQDYEALNLLSRYFLALHTKEKKSKHLEDAWRVTQAVLTSDKIKRDEREAALMRAVELAPKIRDELGLAWLVESFTNRPQRGMEIIAAIGSAAAQGLQNYPTSFEIRLKRLELQSTAVEALLKASPERAEQWRATLNLLAGNWLGEALATYKYDESTSLGPSLQRDTYGNYFYFDRYQYSQRQSGRIQPIPTGKIMEIKPVAEWLALLNDGIRPKFDMVYAQLYLKVAEENLAFPYIEALAKTHPKQAKDLVDEFLRVWTRNHDPNASRNRTNYYMYMYGYERKAESIPLTRSKQERNLKELAELVARLRKLPLEEMNEQLLAKAFTTCHSSAEVYRLEAIEKVFGSLEDLEPKTLAEMTQQMRANLMGVWRQPAVQKDKKTKRKQKDIQAEVLRGYQVAKAVIDRGLEEHPNEWSLQLAKAAIDHDENNYRKELASDSKFTGKRNEAIDGFRKAAEMYAAQVEELEEDEETTKVFEMWYYASLGACDLNQVNESQMPDLRQPKLIREAIMKLPATAVERHLAMFANSLFTRMSAVKPAVKFRYLRAGFEIVGDHKHAHEARKVFDYYKDLVTEIKLETVIDGSDVVGHKKPFGVFVNLRHTREIERESGGFGRYLQNQNTQTGYFSYNYGRPTENYRDKFEEIVGQALEEQFEVLSVTFQADTVNSRAVEEYGWRVTPYAYLLLKARGPEVDTIASLRLDLDFLDTSGYAIIPVESPSLPIDASPETGDERPIDNLDIVQTLDERQADEGKLILEVKATANGLVPDLDQILDLAPKDFEIVEAEDQGLSVSRFNPDTDESVVVSERSWMITMQAVDNLKELPTSFEFGKPTHETADSIYQRYVDADMIAVERVISLEEQYGETSNAQFWLIVGAVAVVAGLACLFLLLRKKDPRAAEVSRFEVPETITAFTVLGLLRQIDQNNGLNESSRLELAGSINRLEQHFFINGSDEEPNLQEMAETWIERAT